MLSNLLNLSLSIFKGYEDVNETLETFLKPLNDRKSYFQLLKTQRLLIYIALRSRLFKLTSGLALHSTSLLL